MKKTSLNEENDYDSDSGQIEKGRAQLLRNLTRGIEAHLSLAAQEHNRKFPAVEDRSTPRIKRLRPRNP